MSRLSPYLLAAALAGAGVAHFRNPRFFDQMVPPQLPGPARAWTYGTGAAEIALAAAVANPRTRKRAALASAAWFVAVFPGNVQMARDAEGARDQALTYARLPLQLPLVRWAWRVSRAAGR